ncbi:C-C chemokine receptor type 2 [Myripristis murdjan]|uniref:C-C chemokine receptor type 2 n=1 Tax=Myripristis murdjan TaxID=586833 RepID=UPI00117648B9|nr:C-C chemokine receptor type 2-like [Myripristis murdjan]XP_029928223.1 C-C chemokine receptor type 2-like [Myripristis murdjan]
MNTTDCNCDYSGFEYAQDCDSAVLEGSSVLPVILYLLFCIGLIGNGTVLWLLTRHIKVKTMTDVCLLNLALSDLIMTLTLPLWAYTSQNHLWSNGRVPCKMMTGAYQLGLYSGTLFVTLMSVDRYLAIVHAVSALRARTLRYGTAASIIVWVISITMATPQVVFADMVTEDDSQTCQPVYPDNTQNTWKILRNFSENTVALFVGLPVMAFCYLKILLVLQKSRNSKKNRAVKLIFTIVCVFVICWVPYNITVFVQTLEIYEIIDNCESSNMIKSALHVSEIIALAHCCVNPVIYAFVGEKFRMSLRKVLSKYLRLEHLSTASLVSQRDTTDKETSNTAVRSEY